MSCCMCWWTKGNVDDDCEARETLLTPEEIAESSTMTKESKRKASKQKQYEDIKNKYRNSIPAQQDNPAYISEEQSNPTPSHAPVSHSASSPVSSGKDRKKKESLKSKVSSKSLSFIDEYSKNKSDKDKPDTTKPDNGSKSTSSLPANEIEKVGAKLAERGDLLKTTVQKTEELQENTRHMRSASRRLKEKQAQKLKKSKLPW